MAEQIEDETVVCDLTQERTHGRRAGWCYRCGSDIAAEVLGGAGQGLSAVLTAMQASSSPKRGSCRCRDTAGRGNGDPLVG